MGHWRKSWYALIGPLMIWVVFIVAAPTLVGGAVMSTADLPGIAEAVIRTILAVCILVLSPLAALAEIAPPFVTREEVAWRNRNGDKLFTADVAWEDTPFLPPLLSRIRTIRGSRDKKDEPSSVKDTPRAKLPGGVARV